MLNSYASILSFLPEEMRERQLRPYYLPLTSAAGGLGIAATIQLTTPLQNVAAYLLTAIVGRVHTAAAPIASIADPAVLIDVRFSAGDDMTFGPVPWSAIVDDAGNLNATPGGLVIPRLVPGGSNVAITLINYSGVAYTVRLGLVGINVYAA